MSVMVAKSHPNILPYAKVRDNPHVSKEEWAALKMCLRPNSVSSLNSSQHFSSHYHLATSASQLHLATIQSEPCPPPTRPTFGSLLSAPPVNTPTPLASPISQCSPNMLESFFQLSNTQPQQAISRCSSSASNNQPQLLQTHHRLTFAEKLSFQQLLKFLQMLTQTAGHFLQTIGVTEADHCDYHRLYSLEVIELNSDVSFILLLPPPDEVCSIFNQTDSLQTPNLTYIPLKIFELST